MTKEEKEQLISVIEVLQEENSLEPIAEMLMSNDETRDDYDLSMLLAKTFIDMDDENEIHLKEAAEMLLAKFSEQGKSDPKWNYLLAYSLYCQNRIPEAVRHLRYFFEHEAADCPSNSDWRDAYELYNVLKDDLEKNIAEYDKDALNTVKKHIENHFGKIGTVLNENEPLGIKIDIAVIFPSKKRNYYTLTTLGMGADTMNIPSELADNHLGRAELVMYLPPDWDMDNDEWAVKQISTIAHVAYDKNTWLGYGHILPSPEPYSADSRMKAMMLIDIQESDSTAFYCPMENENPVFFYQLIPIYPEELKYKLRYGIDALIEKMSNVSAIVDLHRENVCADWEDSDEIAIVGKEADLFSDESVGELCAVSRRIITEGSKVGYMRRILFDPESDLSANDSGWLLLAGDETPEYLSEPYNLGLYSLNTVCNIDPEIIPFLTEPFETVVVRRFGGKLQIVDSEENKFGFLN